VVARFSVRITVPSARAEPCYYKISCPLANISHQCSERFRGGLLYSPNKLRYRGGPGALRSISSLSKNAAILALNKDQTLSSKNSEHHQNAASSRFPSDYRD